MSETPKRPDERESTLSNAAPPAWQPVAAPGFQPGAPQILPPPPPAGGYPGAQGYVPPQGYPQFAPPSPPAATPAGQGGYRPVYDGGAGAGVPPNAGYGAPVYGAQPPNYPPPYGQAGYSPNNYGQTNMAAEMLAMAVLMRRRRRWRRHLFLWPVLFFVFIVMIGLHGCMSFARMF
jgi:hypothetical protein